MWAHRTNLISDQIENYALERDNMPKNNVKSEMKMRRCQQRLTTTTTFETIRCAYESEVAGDEAREQPRNVKCLKLNGSESTKILVY